jgi:hypothetical protein
MIASVTTSQNWRKKKKKKRATDSELSYRNNFFNDCASEKISPQLLLGSRENLTIAFRLMSKAASTGWTRIRNSNTRTRPGAGGVGRRASYLLPHLWLLLALSSRLLSTNTFTSSIPKIGQGELLPTLLVPSTFGSEAC